MIHQHLYRACPVIADNSDLSISLYRQAHVFGAERELVMTAGLVALLVGIGGLTFLSGVSAVVFWLVAVFALRRMARAFPSMSRVWLRHSRQQNFYSARSGH